MRTPAILLLAFTAMGIGAYQTLVNATGTTWQDPEYGKFAVDGVCQITPDSVLCWEPNGKPSDALTGKVRDQITKTGTVRFQVGRKNRYVVTTYEPAADPMNAQSSGSGGPTTAQNSSARFTTSPQTLPPDAKEFEATFEVQASTKLGPFAVEPKAGTKAESGGAEVSVVKVEKIKPEQANSLLLSSSRSKNLWRIYIETKNLILQNIRMEPMRDAKSGSPIRFLDENGHAKPMEPRSKEVPIFAVTSYGKDIVTKAQWFETNVDPSEVKELAFTPWTTKRQLVRFAGLAADPQKSTEGNR